MAYGKCRYTANKMAGKIGVLYALLHLQYESGKDIADCLAELGIKLSKLAAIQIPMEVKMLIAIRLVSLAGEESLSSTITAFKKREADKLTWEVVSSGIIEKQQV